MMMRPTARKFALAVHITVAVGWVGAVLAYLALVGGAWMTADPKTVQAAWVGMELIGWYVLIPLALSALCTGILMGLGTKWGLIQNYWVVFSLLLTVLALAVLAGHMPTVSSFADTAIESASASRAGLPGELLHAGGGLVVLLVIVGLNVYKPRGRTPYGKQKR